MQLISHSEDSDFSTAFQCDGPAPHGSSDKYGSDFLRNE